MPEDELLNETIAKILADKTEDGITRILVDYRDRLLKLSASPIPSHDDLVDAYVHARMYEG